MEGVAFILIGAALFSQSWHFLGLYPDGRTMGTFVGGLGALLLIAITMTPMLLTGNGGDPDAYPLAETTIMTMLIVVWAGYALGVAAQGWFDLDERAIGFYAIVAAAASVVALFYFAITLANPYGDAVSIGLSAAALILSVLGGLIFFYLAIPFNVLRLVAGWGVMLGSIAVTGIGLAIVARVIEIT
jgi:hypothetical protein